MLFNPFAEIGYGIIHAEVKYAISNQGIQHFRYGINVKFELKEQSWLLIGANYGQFNKPFQFKYYEYIPEDDSLMTEEEIIDLQCSINGKNNLWQFKVSYLFQLTPKIDGFIGAHVYYLSTSLVNNNDQSPMIPSQIDERILSSLNEKNFQSLSNYTEIYNNFSMDRNTHSRIWPSIHISLQYRF